MLGLTTPQVWTTDIAYQHLNNLGKADSKRTAERRLHELKLLPVELTAESLQDELGRPANQVVLNWAIEKARSQRKLVLFAQIHDLPGGETCLHANDARGGRYWIPLGQSQSELDASRLLEAVHHLRHHIGKNVALFPL